MPAGACDCGGGVRSATVRLTPKGGALGSPQLLSSYTLPYTLRYLSRDKWKVYVPEADFIYWQYNS